MFENDQDRNLAAEMLRKNRSPQEIIDALAKRCSKHDVSNLKFKLRKAGELPPKAARSKDRTPSTRTSTRKAALDKVVTDEIGRIREEIENHRHLVELYDNKNNDLVEYLEKKIKANEAKLELLEKIV